MNYARLLTIEIKHSYYSDGICPDFSVIPTGDTERTLRNHRCVAKSRANCIDIHIEMVSDETSKIGYLKGDVLSFELYLKNPEFPLFTDCSSLPKGGNDYGYTMYYPTSISTEQFFARVDTTCDLTKIEGKNLEISFPAKPAYWIYYLVTDQSGDFSIAETSQNGMTWKHSDSSDGILDYLAAQYPDTKQSKFVSEHSIPCQEAGFEHIQLLSGEIAIIENLPNPSWRNLTTEGSPSAEAIFHIVKYLSNSTLTKV